MSTTGEELGAVVLVEREDVRGTKEFLCNSTTVDDLSEGTILPPVIENLALSFIDNGKTFNTTALTIT